MNIGFIKKEQKQKYLIVLLAIIALAAVFVLKKDQLLGTGEEIAPAPFEPRKIEIDFDLLNAPVVKDLRIYQEIKPFDGPVGQENPFKAN